MARSVDGVGAATFAVVVLAAGNKNAEAAVVALGAVLAAGLFIYIWRSFDDRDLDPR
jgi:hypothetical protein